MAPSKSTRIIILLAIDSAFFLLELIVGELGSWRSPALLLIAKLTDFQALPYTHWPSLQTPFIWSVIACLFWTQYYLLNTSLTTTCCSSTMSFPFVSGCGRSKWHTKSQARRCTHMEYGNTRTLFTPSWKRSNMVYSGNVRKHWELWSTEFSWSLCVYLFS